MKKMKKKSGFKPLPAKLNYQDFFEEHLDEMVSAGPEVIEKVKARNRALKDSRINMRVNPDDLEKFKTIADEKRIPYQTLIGTLIHEFNVRETSKKRVG